MPNAIDDDTPDHTVGFLQRWSDRKAKAAGHPAAEDANVEIPSRDAGADKPLTEARPNATADQSVSEQPGEPPVAVTEADLENLTYDSDYTKFMGEHVPEALRRRALRTLWRSDPILANVDGICDYDDDFTDAALAVKTLQTAHRIGRGYLDDDDLAANRARGEPAAETTGHDSSSDSEVLSDGEDIEDVAAASPPETNAQSPTAAGEQVEAASDENAAVTDVARDRSDQA